MTKTRPRNRGIDPSTRPPTTINPQTAMGMGFAATARIDVRTAVASPTFRSSNSGNDTTLIVSTTTANTKPTPTQTPIITQPAHVVTTPRPTAHIAEHGHDHKWESGHPKG